MRITEALSAVWLASIVAFGQDTSVRPGVNDPYKEPGVEQWVERFEGESREVFDKRKQIAAAVGLKPGMAVADVGAGTGLYTRIFAEAVGEQGTVYANDITPKFLEYIAESVKKRGFQNVKTVLGTDKSTELPPASVDVVFVSDTYHHFEFPEHMLASIHRSLKPGGRLIVVDFEREQGVSSDWVMGHVRAGQAVVEAEIERAGFRKVDELKGVLKENYMVTFERVAAPASTATSAPAAARPSSNAPGPR